MSGVRPETRDNATGRLTPERLIPAAVGQDVLSGRRHAPLRTDRTPSP